MKTIEQQVQSIFKRAIDNISKTAMVKATNAERNMALELIRERTNNGLDVHGRRLPSLSRNYIKRKKKMIAKGIKGSTEYVAKGIPNHGRLSGRLFTDLNTQQKKIYQTKSGGSLDFGNEFKIYVKSAHKRDKIAVYLKEMGRDIIGIADENSARGKKERDILKKTFLKTLFPKATMYSGKIVTKFL